MIGNNASMLSIVVYILFYRVDLEYTTLQKKLASDLAIEKATAKRIEVELSSLEKSVHQMVCLEPRVKMCGKWPVTLAMTLGSTSSAIIATFV